MGVRVKAKAPKIPVVPIQALESARELPPPTGPWLKWSLTHQPALETLHSRSKDLGLEDFFQRMMKGTPEKSYEDGVYAAKGRASRFTSETDYWLDRLKKEWDGLSEDEQRVAIDNIDRSGPIANHPGATAARDLYRDTSELLFGSAGIEHPIGLTRPSGNTWIINESTGRTLGPFESERYARSQARKFNSAVGSDDFVVESRSVQRARYVPTLSQRSPYFRTHGEWNSTMSPADHLREVRDQLADDKFKRDVEPAVTNYIKQGQNRVRREGSAEPGSITKSEWDAHENHLFRDLFGIKGLSGTERAIGVPVQNFINRLLDYVDLGRENQGLAPTGLEMRRNAVQQLTALQSNLNHLMYLTTLRENLARKVEYLFQALPETREWRDVPWAETILSPTSTWENVPFRGPKQPAPDSATAVPPRTWTKALARVLALQGANPRAGESISKVFLAGHRGSSEEGFRSAELLFLRSELRNGSRPAVLVRYDESSLIPHAKALGISPMDLFERRISDYDKAVERSLAAVEVPTETRSFGELLKAELDHVFSDEEIVVDASSMSQASIERAFEHGYVPVGGELEANVRFLMAYRMYMFMPGFKLNAWTAWPLGWAQWIGTYGQPRIRHTAHVYGMLGRFMTGIADRAAFDTTPGLEQGTMLGATQLGVQSLMPGMPEDVRTGLRKQASMAYAAATGKMGPAAVYFAVKLPITGLNQMFNLASMAPGVRMDSIAAARWMKEQEDARMRFVIDDVFGGDLKAANVILRGLPSVIGANLENIADQPFPGGTPRTFIGRQYEATGGLTELVADGADYLIGMVSSSAMLSSLTDATANAIESPRPAESAVSSFGAGRELVAGYRWAKELPAVSRAKTWTETWMAPTIGPGMYYNEPPPGELRPAESVEFRNKSPLSREVMIIFAEGAMDAESDQKKREQLAKLIVSLKAGEEPTGTVMAPIIPRQSAWGMTDIRSAPQSLLSQMQVDALRRESDLRQRDDPTSIKKVIDKIGLGATGFMATVMKAGEQDAAKDLAEAKPGEYPGNITGRAGQERVLEIYNKQKGLPDGDEAYLRSMRDAQYKYNWAYNRYVKMHEPAWKLRGEHPPPKPE